VQGADLWGSLVDGFTAVINFCYLLTAKVGWGNYGMAIILLTIAMKMLLYPLTAKQMASVKAMQEIQPMVKEIQEKYRKEPEKAQHAIMDLYRQKKVNPLAGCLPLLIQLPILIAFYQALLKFPYVDETAAGFFWIPNLSNPDPWFILPILAAASTFWQQKVSMTSANDQTQKTLLFTMPLFLGYLAYKMPAGLALYWVVFSVLGAVQQMYINSKRSPVEAIPAPEETGKKKRGISKQHEPGVEDSGKGGKDRR